MAAIGSGITGVTNANVTSTLTQEVKTYYEKVFLNRAEYELVLKEGSQMRTHPVTRAVRSTLLDTLL